MKKIFLLLATVGMIFTACETGNEPNGTNNNQPQQPTSNIMLNPPTITTDAGEGNYEVSVNSTCSWTAYSLDSWIKVKTTAGDAGTTTLQFSVTNNSEKESRRGVINLTNADHSLTAELYVIQSALEYKIGDIVSVKGVKGIVFYKDNSITKLVSIAESNTKLCWCIEDVVTSATNQYNGADNMAKIKAINGWETNYPAFKWCADLGDGWYLPAVYELVDFFKQAQIINETLEENGYNHINEDHLLWSSTDATGIEDSAAYIVGEDGMLGLRYKSIEDSFVRAVYTIEN
ncbi:MAG: hypothetical protein E7147_03085 [Rikenellaceae bacterium]|nr:hypothetical protein [Rikenellaceae bacterium]